MPTALAYIEAGLSKIGMLQAGEVVSAEDAALGLLRLNTLLDAMENEGMFGYSTLNTSFTLPANTSSRTIGPSMQINIIRPIRILKGSFATSDGIDYPIEPISEPEYNSISLKTADSIIPCVCFYDGGTPTGNVYFWPQTVEDTTITLVTPTAKTIAVDTTTSIVYPPGYQRYIEHALAIELAPDFDVTPTPFLMNATSNAKRLIKRQNSRIPQMDIEYPSRHGITVDEFRSGLF